MIVAITGGIGAGKSTVSRMLSVMGYPVYDCDSRAKVLVDGSPDIITEIGEKVCREALCEGGRLDRKVLARKVFGDADALARLNGIVHRHVRDDFASWAARQGSDVVFVETAILYQSRMHHMVDCVWDVVAPDEVRISRVILRNGTTRSEVESRISAQNSFQPDEPHQNVRIIINDGVHAVLPQLLKVLASTHIA